MRFFALLFALPLFATVNEPFRVEWFTGYRNDRIHWHLLQGGSGNQIYTERYRDVEFWENGLTLKTIHRDLALCLSGDYAVFGNGTLFQRYGNLGIEVDKVPFQFHTSGWAADASGYFGYAVNLTAGRTYKVILLPLLGFSTHFEQLRRGEGSPNPFAASSFTMTSTLPGKFAMTWYGFFLGGGFLFDPVGRLSFEAGYTYHWLHFRLKSKRQNQISLFTNGALTSDQITATSLKAKQGGNLGHTGWVQAHYLLSHFWKIGLGGQIRYFSCNLFSVKETQETTSLVPAASPVTTTVEQKLKMRWVPISGWISISRAF